MKSELERGQLQQQAMAAACQLLFAHYQELAPAAIKVYLAIVAQARVEVAAPRYCLSKRPSIRALAKICHLSKATVQNGLQILTAHRLLIDNRPALAIADAYLITEELPSLTPATIKASEAGVALSSQKAGAFAAVSRTELAPAAANELAQASINANISANISADVGVVAGVVVPPATPANIDHELIARYQEGDKEAFAELYQRHFEPVRLHVSHYLPESTSYDVAQQIFFELMKKLKVFQLDGRAKFTTWLYKFTELSLTNVRRKNRREVPMASDAEKYDIQTIIRLTSPQQQIMPYLITLDEIQQRCVYYYYYEGLSYDDISKKLALNKNVVRSYLQTARRHIRSQFNPPGQAKRASAQTPAASYNKFFQAALEKEREQAEANNGIFSLALLTASSSDSLFATDDQVISVLGRVVINYIRGQYDQAFQLGNKQFGLIFRNISAPAAATLLNRISNGLAAELGRPMIVSGAIIEYCAGMSLDTLLHKTYLKYLAAQAAGDAILIAE